jgi:methylenetetrahydrofolate dehydrogenase (NADP+) / methenyltetrahydrofolate cyclohydrolase
MATRIDGKRVAADLKQQLAAQVPALQAQGVQPWLGTIVVGDDPGGRAYVAGKHCDCTKVSIASPRVKLPAAASQGEVEKPCAR